MEGLLVVFMINGVCLKELFMSYFLFEKCIEVLRNL